MVKKSGDPAFVPKRGDAVWLDFDPQARHEQRGRRPAVVISPRAYNAKVGLALVCPITSQRKDYPFEVDIPAKPAVSGVVLSDQIKSLDWQVRNAELIAALPSKTVAEILAKIAPLLLPAA
ncbi:MAG TPA: endoribonuclease MazF [Thermoanaerobaculia bacterium]|nr:endoribonuclease MazF [Thermoanaerobaculia bacterium]